MGVEAARGELLVGEQLPGVRDPLVDEDQARPDEFEDGVERFAGGSARAVGFRDQVLLLLFILLFLLFLILIVLVLVLVIIPDEARAKA